ncbi:MAG TPA: thioredoxin family protein [Thermoanaerobaculia bacterium]|nr:thioredoxin family protein [Thermoanaerobaculia bacterium]
MQTNLTFDRTKQRALPVWLPLLAALLIVARIVSWKYPAMADVDLVHWTDPALAAGMARGTHRPILYEFSAEWCGPCHQLEREVFMDPDLAAKINSRYIAVKVVDRQREDGHNAGSVQELLDRYGVNGFPTIVIAAGDGSVRDRTMGYFGRDKFAQFIDRVR